MSYRAQLMALLYHFFQTLLFYRLSFLRKMPSDTAERLACQLRIPEVPNPILDPESLYPDRDLRSFHQSIQANLETAGLHYKIGRDHLFAHPETHHLLSSHHSKL